MNDEENRICSLVRKSLGSFPLYKDDHKIFSKIHSNGISIDYSSKKGLNLESFESTRFGVQISDKICYILWISIDREKRREGCGRKLCQSIENFIKELNCEKVELVASGKSPEFWRKIGFKEHPNNSFVFVKYLN